MNFDLNTIGILLIVAGALWGIWEIFKRLPKSQLAPEQQTLENDTPSLPEEDLNGDYFFVALLGHIRKEDGSVRQHLIDAGIAKLQSYNSDKPTDGNNPTT